MNVLVIGGLGYIGSHMCKTLEKSGHCVTIIDNLSTGNITAARGHDFHEFDLLDSCAIDNFFSSSKKEFDVVMHFAAKSLVAESVSDPGIYYRNNVSGTLNVLKLMREYSIKNFIFSSTAATFGEPKYLPIDEAHSQHPINPYGESKLMVEKVLVDYASAYGLNSVSLRYFNACGADPDGEIGECHDPETHLIPLILQVASGRRDSISVFGRDYNTLDGTCIRDYIHVVDLCDAHEKAMQALVSGSKQGAHAYNLGNGGGFSVQQVIDVAQRIVAEDGKSILVKDEPRRTGDPAKLVADASMAKQELGWHPQFADLETIIRHAWNWEKKMAGL